MGHRGKIISSSLTPIYKILVSYGGAIICLIGILILLFIGVIPGLLILCCGIALLVTWWKVLRETAEVYLGDDALHVVKHKTELAVPYNKIINVRKIRGLRFPPIAVDYSIDGKGETVVFIPSHGQFYPLLGVHRIDLLIESIKGRAEKEKS
jgi:hypothetical protein